MGRLYYTGWPKFAVGNADCSLKNIFIVSFIIIFGTLSFSTADFDHADGVVESAHYCRRFGDLFR